MTKTRRSLLFVNQFYWPDVAATGQHLTDLAEHLAGRGERVTVFTALARYAGGKAEAPAREKRNGVKIRRFRSPSFGRATHVGRIADYLSFYLQVLFAIIFGRSYDGVIYLTTPPLIFVAGRLARAIRGQRYAIWSMDLHPAAEIAAGMLRADSVAARLLQWLYLDASERADFVICLGSFMRDRLIAAGIQPDRVSIVPPWSSTQPEDSGRARDAGLRKRLGLGDRFLVMYSGNAGMVHAFDAICDAMQILKDDDRFFFLFIGDGPRRREIETFARRERLRHFAYHDYLLRNDTSDSLAAADAHLISLRPEFAGISVPSKLYGIMAAGRPALFVGPLACESAQAILDHDCGAIIDVTEMHSRAGAGVADTLREWLANPGERKRLGENAQRAFRREYERASNCTRMTNVIDSRWRTAHSDTYFATDRDEPASS